MLEGSAVLAFSKSPCSAFGESQNWHQVQSKWTAVFLRKHLLLKGLLIHSVFVNKAFDSCFGQLLLRSEMMVSCSSLTKAASGAWSLFPYTTGPAASSPPALGAHECVLWGGERGQKDWKSLGRDFGCQNLGASKRHWVPLRAP